MAWHPDQPLLVVVNEAGAGRWTPAGTSTVDVWCRRAVGDPNADRLWIGTPSGTLVELDVDGQEAVEHALAERPVTALATTAPGELVVAAGAELVFPTVPTAEADAGAVAEFLAATAEAPEDETGFVRSDGTRDWRAEDLAEVTAAEPADPTWLRLQAAINTRSAP